MMELIITLTDQRMITLEANGICNYGWIRFIQWFERKRSRPSYKLDGIPYAIKKEEIIQIKMIVPTQQKTLSLNIGEFSREKTVCLLWRSADA
jgi:hypothetical protein